jgi:hypothetical protein
MSFVSSITVHYNQKMGRIILLLLLQDNSWKQRFLLMYAVNLVIQLQVIPDQHFKAQWSTGCSKIKKKNYVCCPRGVLCVSCDSKYVQEASISIVIVSSFICNEDADFSLLSFSKADNLSTICELTV